MVYTRKVRRGSKTYLYKYKSQRVNGKVKSIYIGKELQKSVSKKIKVKKHKTTNRLRLGIKKDVPEYLMHFNSLMNEINNSLSSQDVDSAIKNYKELLNTYHRLIRHLDNEDKLQIYNKVKQTYDSITFAAESLGFTIKK